MDFKYPYQILVTKKSQNPQIVFILFHFKAVILYCQLNQEPSPLLLILDIYQQIIQIFFAKSFLDFPILALKRNKSTNETFNEIVTSIAKGRGKSAMEASREEELRRDKKERRNW